MLLRVGSTQTNDEFWINPEHVISVRVQKGAGTAVIKLSDGTTHNIQIRCDVPVVEADALKLLHGRSSVRLAELLMPGVGMDEPRLERRSSAQ